MSNQRLSDKEREKLVAEWEELSAYKDVLRIWKNGKLHRVAADYYDNYIIDAARKLHNKQENKGFIKSARLIGEVIGQVNQYIGDQYLEY